MEKEYDDRSTYGTGFASKIKTKIYILFILDELNYPVEYDTVCAIMEECGYVTGFDFTECFSELCDSEHIYCEMLDGVKYCLITELGKMVSRELQDRIVESIREESSLIAHRYFSLKQRGIELSTRMETREDGKQVAICTMSEKGGILLEYKVCVTSEGQAENIREYFKSKPNEILRGLMAVVTGEMDYILK